MGEVKVALVGNPNIGKTTLFNQLTGLNQQVGNYPGITVDKTTGKFHANNIICKLYDLPGVYSLYPNAYDEEIVASVLLNKEHPDHPDKLILVANAANLKRSLLLVEQVADLGIPSILVLNMADEATRNHISIHVEEMSAHYGIPVLLTNARKSKGIAAIKKQLDNATIPQHHIYKPQSEHQTILSGITQLIPNHKPYIQWQALCQKDLGWLTTDDQLLVKDFKLKHQVNSRRLQVSETLQRYRLIDELIRVTTTQQPNARKSFSEKIDRWAMHPFWGYVIFAILIFLVFQSIFTFSEYPMQWIEYGMNQLTSGLKNTLPAGPLTSFITDGIISGLGGILIFIPQIFILFLFLLIMEQSGYMSRVVYLMDKWMQPFGLNGKSVVPLISGAACAVPAIMSARNIDHKKERLVTILVTPFMTCSARLPVYTIIIGLVIPAKNIAGFNLHGLVLLFLYFLGLLSALVAGYIYHKTIQSKYKSYLIIELPGYKMPVLKSLIMSLYEKIKSFVFGAGKIILVLSMILWIMASFGPTSSFRNAEQIIRKETTNQVLTEEEIDSRIATYKLEHSFLGYMGKAIEPGIAPLGYDWKIGIGILSSFAAREVFVPTMATIYSINGKMDKEIKVNLKQRMQNETNPSTGKPVYNFASGISLLLFYAFAMMCMSTFATVKRETKTWKWPLIQLFSMTGLAYIVALVTYQIIR